MVCHHERVGRWPTEPNNLVSFISDVGWQVGVGNRDDRYITAFKLTLVFYLLGGVALLFSKRNELPGDDFTHLTAAISEVHTAAAHQTFQILLGSRLND